MDSLVGKKLSHYRVLDRVGAGGMGVVYRARDERLGRDVALKVLPEEFRSDERRRRFETEARAAAALSHPNVLAVFDVSSEGEHPFLVTELLDGRPLSDLLATNRPGPKQALRLAAQAARGLAAAHERGIVHRDIKPSNLFVQRDGTLKILDFGLARMELPAFPPDATRTLEGKISEPVTMEGTVMGTVAYMAPEQVQGKSADARSDLFSLGCVIYEMLTGTRAFDGPTAVEISYRILHDEPSAFPDTVSPATAGLCLRCLEKDPVNRFQSARDLGFALEMLDAPSSRLDVRQAPRPRRMRRAAAYTGAAAVLAVVGFLGGRDLLSPPNASREGEIRFTPLTFRLGVIGNARFAPDGKTVVFSAERDERGGVFTAMPGNPEVRNISGSDTELLDVSAKGEMALMERPGFVLARAPLAGGEPRPVLDKAFAASWSPDGNDLLVAHFEGGKIHVEYPLGHELLESDAPGLLLRVAPAGDLVALVEHRIPSYLEGRIEVVGLDGSRRPLTDTYASISSIAWSPDGKEVWFTASTTRLSPRTLMGVNLKGKVRIIRKSPVAIRIHDCTADGNVLLSVETFHHRIAGVNGDHEHESDLSWFEGSDQPSMSADGRWLLSTVVGEAAGGKNQVYLRDDEQGTAVHLGQGNALALSPDGLWALVGTGPLQSDLELLPTGVGEPRRLEKGEISAITTGFWFADGQRLLVVGHEAGKLPRAWILDLPGGPPHPVTDEGVLTACPPSPDGAWIAAFTRERKATLVPVAGGKPKALDGLPDRYLPVGWGKNGKSLFVRKLDEVSRLDGYVTTGAPVRIETYDLATGRLAPWREITPGEPAGNSHVDNVVITPDGASYAYAYATFSSVLYLVEGLR